MRKGLLFMSMLAFICNLCFVISIIARKVPEFAELPQFIKGTIGVLFFLSVFVNIFTNAAVLVGLAFKIKPKPVWLAVTNFILLIFQFVASYFTI